MKEVSIDFKKIHDGFDGMMFDLCEECGGQCEKSNLTMLLHGEAEYIAKKLKLNLNDFINKFCNIVKIADNNRYIYIY